MTDFKSLYQLAVEHLTISDIKIDHNILEFTCRSYYENQSRLVTHNKLKSIFTNRPATVSAIMMLTAALKNETRDCFSKYNAYCLALRQSLAELESTNPSGLVVNVWDVAIATPDLSAGASYTPNPYV